MLASIEIKDLEVQCIIGVLPRERLNPQPLLLDLQFNVEIDRPALEDSIDHALDYSQICTFLQQWISKQKFQLIETLAAQTVHQLSQKWPNILNGTLTIKKIQACSKARWIAIHLSWPQD